MRILPIIIALFLIVSCSKTQESDNLYSDIVDIAVKYHNNSLIAITPTLERNELAENDIKNRESVFSEFLIKKGFKKTNSYYNKFDNGCECYFTNSTWQKNDLFCSVSITYETTKLMNIYRITEEIHCTFNPVIGK